MLALCACAAGVQQANASQLRFDKNLNAGTGDDYSIESGGFYIGGSDFVESGIFIDGEFSGIGIGRPNFQDFDTTLGELRNIGFSYDLLFRGSTLPENSYSARLGFTLHGTGCSDEPRFGFTGLRYNLESESGGQFLEKVSGTLNFDPQNGCNLENLDLGFFGSVAAQISVDHPIFDTRPFSESQVRHNAVFNGTISIIYDYDAAVEPVPLSASGILGLGSLFLILTPRLARKIRKT